MVQSSSKCFGWAVAACVLVAIVAVGCKPAAPPSPPGKSPPPKQQAKVPEQPPEEPQPTPTTQPAPEEPVAPPPGPSAEPEESQPAKLPDLGPPLVDKVEDLKRLDPEKPLWLDAAGKRVIMVGRVCQTDVPLELFACPKDTKEHEAIVTVDVKAFAVHAALLALGAKPGTPAQFNPVYKPAAGTEIEIAVAWKDKDGQRQTARAQDWIYDVAAKKAMSYPWVFAGSGFWQDESTGQKHYLADGGDFICVSNFPSAMLDLPIESTQSNTQLLFKAYTQRIPPRNTPVTLILKPKLEP